MREKALQGCSKGHKTKKVSGSHNKGQGGGLIIKATSLGMQVCVKGCCVGSSQLFPDKQKKECLTKKWCLTGQDCYDLHLKLIVCLLNTCKLQLWFINTNKVFCKLL